MLPEVDIKKWNASNGFEKSLYTNYWTKKVNDMKPEDDEGYTTPQGAKIVSNINAYIMKSSLVAWKMYLIETLFKKNGDVYQSNKVFKVLRGLAKQRKLSSKFKRTISRNPVNDIQARVSAVQIKKLEDRLVFLERSFIPAISGSTDLKYYLVYLKENDITLQSELENFLDPLFFKKFLEDMPTETENFMSHVFSVIDSMRSRTDIAEAIAAAKTIEDRMHEESVKSAIKYKQELNDKNLKETEDIVNALSSKAQKTFGSIRTLPDVKAYVCTAAYVPSTYGKVVHSGYVRTTNGRKAITKNPSLARLYSSENDAVAAGEELKEQSVHRVIYNVVPIFRR